MAKQTINIGTTANDGTGDTLRAAFDKCNDNFTELYTDDAGDVGSIVAGDAISVSSATGDVTVNVSGLTTSEIAAATLVIESEGIGSNDNDTTLPTSAAVKDYVDTQISGITDNDTTYTAGSGLDLNTQTNVFSLETDLRDGVTHIGLDTGDYIEFTDNTRIDFYVNGSNEMRLEADGDLHVDGDVIAASTTVSSDETLKDNIKIYKNALATLEGIKGVSFEWKKDGKKSGGVIAQDVQKVLPELIGTKKSIKKEGEETLTVDYNGLVGVLIQAVKELSYKVEKLENR